MPADSHSIPTPALILGLGGLLPFICSAVLLWVPIPLDALPDWLVRERGVQELATMALSAYGAVILSFLGGVRWGNILFDNTKLHRWTPLVLSVLPSLIAWVSLLLDSSLMLIVLAVAFCLQLIVDTLATYRGELPHWFLRLRRILTAGAVISLQVGLFGLLTS